MKKSIPPVMLGCALAFSANTWAEKSDDMQMLELASKSGCVTCHSITAEGKGPGGLKPIGPPWQKVAEKYSDEPDAVAQLTNTVMTGSSVFESHWKGDVSGIAMPPNAAAISQEDATKLVTWILGL